MSFFEDLTWRTLVHQATDADLGGWLAEKPRTLYSGFDPTAESLHVGSLLPVMTLRRFQQAGHRPIALVGGATGMIGDPSGKSQERNLLDDTLIERNVAGIRRQLETLLDFDDAACGAVVVNNIDWMGSFGYLEFLRDVGKHFPVNVMMSKDSVKSRLGRDDTGISYTEFSYMLLQAYDFVNLHESLGCELQVGGSDQWGNITAGIDLARRMKSVSLQGMTCPLLLNEDGTKMGKTEAGAVWLDASLTSPYAFYQYWINVGDTEAGNCLRLLTELPREEIEALDSARDEDAARRESQRRLAEELTHLVHGRAGLEVARRATEIFFGAEITNVDDAQLASIFADVPSREVTRDRLAGDGLNILDALVEAGLAPSKSAARRTVEGGGGYVNNRRVEGIATKVTLADLASESMVVLRSGKKKYALLRVTGG